MTAKLREIEDQRGWLIVVTSRLCLDRIKSARSRRERARDASEVEFVAPPQSGLADPADRVTFDDGVRLALLVVLQQLSPAERVVFVLHDVFRMPFDTVAETVGRSGPACRQLASRARQKIAASQGIARFDIASAEHRLVTEKFIAACSNGDLSGLLEILAPDAWGDVDLGPGITGLAGVVKGANRVAKNLLRFWGQARHSSPFQSAVSPRCSPSPAENSPACWRSPCAASLSRRSTSSGTPASWTSSARSSPLRLAGPLGPELTGLADVTIRGHVSSLLMTPQPAGQIKEQPDELTAETGTPGHRRHA
jgi:hypothetical protein